MVSFWTIKIAGVSGTGKTTVMQGLKSMSGFVGEVIIYSQLLREYGDKDLADLKLADILHRTSGLVLMDDHLEFDNPNKTRNYMRENTRGLVLLDVPLKDLMSRVSNDASRTREIKPRDMSRNLQLSRRKAMQLSHETKVPLLVIPNLEGEVNRSIALIAAFVATNSPAF
ncbi:AAA family ATPase [Patescibacteria group bacterium]|nr:AAA family ATPase [Patescibacteria group bacterium]